MRVTLMWKCLRTLDPDVSEWNRAESSSVISVRPPSLGRDFQRTRLNDDVIFIRSSAQNVRISLFASLSVVNHCCKVELSIVCNTGTNLNHR